MKILYIAPYFFPAVSIGGTAKALYNLSRILLKNKHEITVLTTDLFSKERRIDVCHNIKRNLDGIKVIYFSNLSNKLAYQYHLFFPFKYFHYLSKNIKKYDLVHLHEIYTFMHLWAGFLAHKNNIPYVITAHGTAMLKKEEGRVGRKKIFNSLGGIKLLKGAAKVIALTTYEKKSFLKLGIEEEKIAVIPNGLDIKSDTDGKNGDWFKKKYHIPSRSKILLFLGRIHPKKGIDLLIDSLVHLKKKFADLVLVIAGPIESQDYYRKLIKKISDYKLEESVFFTGILTEEDKNCAYKASHTFVLTSYAEGLPMSVLEAASFGLPLLVSKSCGIPEVISYKAGLVVKTKTNDIVSGIEKILSYRNFRNYFGRNGQKMIREKFSLEKMVADTERLYKSILIKK